MRIKKIVNSKILGSVFMVAGVAIGAGMLALPLVTASMGFVYATLLLVLTWLMSLYAGLLMLEVNLRLGQEVNLFTAVGSVLGRPAQWVINLAFLLLLFALTAAYLAGGAALLMDKLNPLLGVQWSSNTYVILFTLVLGSVIGFGVTWVERVSSVFFTLKLVAFGILLVLAAQVLTPAQLTWLPRMQDVSENSWLVALPVVFTSFGFHVCISVLVKHLEGDVSALKKVLVLGSALPLLFYVLWLIVSFGIIPNRVLNHLAGDLTNMTHWMNATVDTAWFRYSLALFTDLALITSFLGVSVALFDFIRQTAKIPTEGIRAKLGTLGLTFTPPILCVLIFPGSFLTVLTFAALPAVILIVAMPIAMRLKLQSTTAASDAMTPYRVGGGGLGLGLLAMYGVLLLVAQFFA
jgi:tyrosine-specific transport protein